jgi:hypothetical protein
LAAVLSASCGAIGRLRKASSVQVPESLGGGALLNGEQDDAKAPNHE